MVATVCVTGASGFIAAYVVKDLLEQGYDVRGTVRSLSQPEKYAYLTSLPGATERLTLMEGELLTEGSYDEAIAGCDYVIHVASPYITNVKDPQTELVDPAIQGTLNVLKASQKASTVKRVVLTSSGAAITDEAQTGKVFTEDDWNEKSTLRRNPYYLSKVAAEKAAWDFVENSEVNFDLVVINPTYVIGPALNPALNNSNAIVNDLLSGAYPVIINLEWPFVDVRDVARAHRLAMEKPDAQGRYICDHESWTFPKTAEFFRQNGYANYRIPSIKLTSALGNRFSMLFSYAQPSGTRAYMQTHVGREIRYDNSKIKRDLGIEFMSVEQSLLDTAEDLVKWGHLKE